MIGNGDGSNPQAQQIPRARSRRGTLTILAIFVVGGLFVGGLWLVSRRMPPAYVMSEVGTPTRTLRVASRSVGYSRRETDALTEQVRSLDPKPDFLMVQQIGRKEAHDLAQALEMRHGGTVQMFYSLNDPATDKQPGNAILAKWPLYQGRTMVKRHPRQFGVFVEAVVEGKRFLLGCWDLSPTNDAAHEAALMLEAWRTAGAPPMIVGGLTSGLGMQVDQSAVGGFGLRPPPRIAGLPEGLQRFGAGYREVWATDHWTALALPPPPTTRPTRIAHPTVVEFTGL